MDEAEEELAADGGKKAWRPKADYVTSAFVRWIKASFEVYGHLSRRLHERHID